MAISKIQYDDKVAINIDSTIPNINKCNASDLNEIKSVVNNNADEIPTISDEYGTSTADGYSQNYINENTINSSGEPSTSEEDVSSATFTNTLEAPMNIDLKGNTLQNGTPTPSSPIPINNVSGDNDIVVCGKNLFDKDNANIIEGFINGQTKQITSYNITRSAYIPCKPNTTYTITKTKGIRFIVGTTQSVAFNSYCTNIQSGNDGAATHLTITSGANDKYIIVFYYKSDVDTLTEQEIRNSIMIEKGNQATTYEAYNGTTYNIDLPVENLFDKDSANVINAYFNSTTPTISQDVGSRTIYIPCKPNTTYTISKTITNRFAIGYTTTTPALNVSVSGVIQNNSANSITITTGNNATHLVVFMWISTDTKTYIEVRDTLQIEYGSKANTYTPYGTTPIELNKIGTYQDYFYKENDKWYLHKEIGKYTFTGDETFNLQNSNKRIHIINTNNQLGDILKTTGGSGILYGMYSNKLEEKTAGQTWSGIQGISYDYNSGANQEDIDISINGLTTIEQYKSAINGITMYFILNTPTNTLITYTPLIEQLESIKNAMSKAGTTNVNQVNNDLPFILDLSVFNDTYNGRYESLVEQIPNNDNLVNVGTYVNDNYKVNMLYSHNLFDKNTANVLNAYFVDGTNNITADTSGNNKTIYIPCKPNTTYTIQKTASPSNRAIGYTTTTPAVNVAVQGAINILANTTTKSITTGNNAEYLVIRVWSGTQDTITYQQMLDSVMINEGSEALDYEPYVVPSINVDGEEIYNANLMNYSTNEVVVGKWVDGRNVYRIVVSGTTASAQNTWKTLTTINNLDSITRIDFSVVIADSEKYTNNINQINFYNNNGALNFKPTSNFWIDRPITAIFEYIKTTD